MARLVQTDFNPERQVYTYAIIADTGGEVGMAQLRLVPSKGADMPEGFESHVYYEVNEAHRGKGYATEALKELVKVAAANNISPLIATVNTENAPSIAVIKKCGGKLADESESKSGTKVQKYIIDTAGV